MRCAACRAEIAKHGRFCPECAAPLAPNGDATETMAMPLPPPPQQSASPKQPSSASSHRSSEDGRFPPGTLTVGATAANYTASFKTQYQLTILASPAGGGSVTPPSGSFYDSGMAVSIGATANSGFSFTNWTGPVASAGSESTTVNLSGPQTVTANFTANDGHPAFFSGEDLLSGIVYYLQFPNSSLFGYYEYLSNSILYHFDLGYDAFVPSSGGQIYLYDFASGHWWYSSSSLFPYLYDFTLNTFIYYFPDTKTSGHYATNPRYFSNLTTGKIFTM